MSSEFTLSQGAGQKLEFAVQRNGGTTDDIEYLSTGDNFRRVTLLRTGKAKLVEVTDNGSEGAVIPTAPTSTAWTVDDEGSIHFTVTSNGMTGRQWINRLQKKGFRLNRYAKSLLLCSDFKPTIGVRTEIAILKGMLFKDDDTITPKIRAEAALRKLQKPKAEVSCLIREMCTDKDIEAMGLSWIVTMHEPIKDTGGDFGLLGSDRSGAGNWFFGCYNDTGDGWSHGGGFAFAVSEVST